MRHTYEHHVQALKTAGVSGQSMQDKLAEILASHDLAPEVINRICEDANRAVHIELTKQAIAAGKTAQLKFPLVEPSVAVKHARKLAENTLQREASIVEKIAAVMDAGGDPFRAPAELQEQRKLSLYGVEADPHTIALKEAYEARDLLQRLQVEEAKLLEVQKTAERESMKILGDASAAHKKMVDSAVEMVLTQAIKLPDLYIAIQAAVGGAECTEEQRDEAKKLLRMVIAGLKKRGVPNHRMGFRKVVNANELDAKSAEEIAELCEKAVDYTAGVDRTLKLAASYVTLEFKGAPKPEGNSAETWLTDRASMNDPDLTDKFDPALARNEGVAINGDAEFVIAVKDLVGARDRTLRMHNAQEYIGAQLGAIRELLEKVHGAASETSSIRDREGKAFDEARGKTAHPAIAALGAVARGAASALPGLLGGKSETPAPVAKVK